MAERTLKSVIKESGAVFPGACGGPVSFGDMEAEYRAVREGAGLVDRSSRGKGSATGSDRATFLHGMLTNTVTGLSAGQGNHACLTDPRGATQADLHLFHCGDRFLFETEPGLQAQAIAFMNRFLIADDARLEDVTTEFELLGVHGPSAFEVVRRAIGDLPALPPDHHVTASFDGGRVMAVHRRYTGETGVDLWTSPGLGALLWGALVQAGARPVGEGALEVLRVEAGVPRYSLDLDSSVAPPEGGLARTVDYGKGCFLGQEMLAKMHNLGKPRRHLVGLRVEGPPPEPETPLLDGDQEVGRTKSSLWSIGLGAAVALASVRRGLEAPGTPLRLQDGKGALVATLPFLAPSDAGDST